MNHLEKAQYHTVEANAGGSKQDALLAIANALIAIAEQRKPAELRPVEITTPGDNNEGACWEGRFHKHYTDPDNKPCVIVETSGGTLVVVELYKSNVRFLDRQPQDEPADEGEVFLDREPQPQGEPVDEDEDEFPRCPDCFKHHDPARRGEHPECLPF